MGNIFGVSKPARPGRAVPMKVICAGLPRTGSKSLQSAMERLGYKETHHMMTSILEVNNVKESKVWMKALSAKFDGKGTFEKEDWDELLGNCQAVTDFPCVAFIPKLVKAYPDAKVVLNTRDVDKWHTSVMNTIEKLHRGMRSEKGQGLLKYAAAKDPDRFEVYSMIRKMWACVWDGDFENNGKRKFDEHNDMVRRLVPADNLLEFTVQEGWGPLCEFLGVPVPDEPFPRVNDSMQFSQQFEIPREEGNSSM